MNYSEFKNEILERFQVTQEEFLEKYDMYSFNSWFYNQSTELLTLSNDDAEINFKYIPVGTYSLNTKTWMWAWQNQHSMEKSKSVTIKVKQFGVLKGYERLAEGYFNADQYTGWELTAICQKIIGGLGGYRAISGHHEVYFLVKEQVDNELAKEIKDLYIQCGKHRYGRRAFVCQHLNKTYKTGFEEAFETDEDMELGLDDDLQAWCDECEKVRQREGEWNDISIEFADIKLVCEYCYFEMKAVNVE